MQQQSLLAAVSDQSINSAISDKEFSVVQVISAALLGVAMLYGVGIASMDVAHNAAHDARHAFAFPCH